MMLWLKLVVLQVAAGSALRLPLEAFQESEIPRLGSSPSTRTRLDRLSAPRRIVHRLQSYKIIFQTGDSEDDLPICSPRAVCNKVDLYDENRPWIERQCRCSGHHACKSNLVSDDGHTLVDKTRHYKMCEPIKKLPKCRYFRDPAWTLVSNPDANITEQIVHCHCPKNSITYLQNKQSYESSTGRIGFQYSFACSPQSRLRCSRKEPCRLFTVRKRQEALEEVNPTTLCQCPRAHSCPRRHSSVGVLPGKTYAEESIRTYSGYCMPMPPPPEPPQSSE